MCLAKYTGIVAKHPDNVKAASLSMTAQPPADMNFLTNFDLKPRQQMTIGPPPLLLLKKIFKKVRLDPVIKQCHHTHRTSSKSF